MLTLVRIGLCVTSSLHVFAALSFITGLTSVTTQIMIPLASSLAVPDKRARAMSICGAGIMCGLLFARLFSGILTNYTSWRTIFYFALGLQYATLGLL